MIKEIKNEDKKTRPRRSKKIGEKWYYTFVDCSDYYGCIQPVVAKDRYEARELMNRKYGTYWEMELSAEQYEKMCKGKGLKVLPYIYQIGYDE